MFRWTKPYFALGPAMDLSPYVTKAQVLIALHKEHRKTVGLMQQQLVGKDGQRSDIRFNYKPELVDKANKIEKVFARELEEMRGVYTVASTFRAGNVYNEQLWYAMRHFGQDDDPLYKQLSLSLGKVNLPKGTEVDRIGAKPRLTGYSGGQITKPSRPGTAVGSKSFSTPGNTDRFVSSDFASAEEFPRPASTSQQGVEDNLPDRSSSRSTGSPNAQSDRMHIQRAHRGHWVLGEDELAMSRDEFEVDPW